MPGINKVILVGRAGQDPRTTRFDSGDIAVEFSLATSDSWRDRSTGERKQHTDWHNIKITSQNIAKIAQEWVKKGGQVGVVGELKYRKWQKNGEDRLTTEILISPFRGELHLLDVKDDSGGGRGRRADRGQEKHQASSGGGTSGGYNRDLDDEIPFGPAWR
jgi:single-strand DNA-binding protein